MATTGHRLVFCGLQQFRPVALTSAGLVDPERADITAATPGPAFNPGADGLLVIPYKNRQPLPVIHPCLCDVILVETIFQEPHVFESRMGFYDQVSGIHDCLTSCEEQDSGVRAPADTAPHSLVGG